MKKLFMLLFIVCFTVLVAQTVQPTVIVAENATATWCGYCPDAYAGLDVVHEHYNFSEFVSIRYYATSGDYGTAETDAAHDYYGVTGLPTTVFMGTDVQGGGGDAVATGAPFMAIAEKYYLEPSPIKVEILSFDNATGNYSAKVEMFSPDYEITNANFRVILMEEEVTSEYTHLTRDIASEPITLSGNGQFVEFSGNLPLDASWVTENLVLVAFVQEEDTKKILNTDSTYPKPEYRNRVTIPFNVTAFGPSDMPFETELFSVFNQGEADNLTLTATVVSGPDGSQASLLDNGTENTTIEANMDADSFKELALKVTPGGAGMVKVSVTVSSDNAEEKSFSFTFISDDTDVLVVDDDGGETFDQYFVDALAANNITYGVWDRAKNELTDACRENFDTIIWNVGWNFPSLTPIDREFIETYIDAGKHLFISGQDIGWDLNDSDDNTDVEFYHNYLHADYLSDDVNILDLSGVAGIESWEEVDLHIAGGDGANNQQYPSTVTNFDDHAEEILHYTNGQAGALRAIHPESNAKIVYFAFGYEAIDNAEDRNQVMGIIYEWFNTTVDNFEHDNAPQNEIVWMRNYPNPFSMTSGRNAATTIRYSFSEKYQKEATISIFNVKGQEVAKFDNLKLNDNHGEIVWNCSDKSGNAVATGVYLYKLSAGPKTLTQKMLMMK